MFDCFTGFKWIAAVICENEGKKEYIGGGEESYGFLPEDFARDKDAVSACTVMAEIAAWAKDNGKTLFELLQDIYVEYGYGKEKGISVVRKGKSGAEEIAQMMRDFQQSAKRNCRIESKSGKRLRSIENDRHWEWETDRPDYAGHFQCVAILHRRRNQNIRSSFGNRTKD